MTETNQGINLEDNVESKKKKDSAHAQRLRGGFLMAFIGFSSMVIGGFCFTALCSLLFYIATGELVKLCKQSNLNVPKKPLQILNGCFPFFAAFDHNLYDFWLVVSIVIILLFLLFGSVDGKKKQSTLSEMAVSVFTLVYVGWLGSRIVLIRFMDEPFNLFALNFRDQGILFCFTVILTIVINDTASYYCGKAFGHTKLAESISPNKTIKGSLGGIFFGVLGCLLMIHLLGPWFSFKISWPLSILFALAINCLGQLGDLVESMMKRAAGVKDAGQLIEGHGGVLDRFDSHILPYVFTWYFLKLYNLLLL